MTPKYEPFKFRYERFGGILQLERPNALIYVDRDYMRDLGYPDSPLWDEDGSVLSVLSAPTEVHLALTKKCSAGCRMCYMDSAPDGAGDGEMGREGVFAALARLAKMRVFHLALGGGESTELPWLFEVAHVARGLGMIPNLTTNGFHITGENAAEFAVFGQVNISIDGVGDRYATHRGINGFDRAFRALRALKRKSVRTGINCVVSRHNFEYLEEIFALGEDVGIQQLELLRYKPAGRAADIDAFLAHDLDDDQAWRFFPKVMDLAKEYDTPLAIDCSLTPYLYCHNPDQEKLEFYGVTGCHGGNMLCGVGADGAASACSFASSENRTVFNIQDWWGREDTFFAFRKWVDAAPQPCASCDFLKLCRGGCHVVSKHESGDIYAPDPGCPKVRRYNADQAAV
ncbi:MAG: radical SAM protein [Deltaproteobacteria bacterium]|nr:radical SAM protein [Deltaproteobacteria bacterium]